MVALQTLTLSVLVRAQHPQPYEGIGCPESKGRAYPPTDEVRVLVIQGGKTLIVKVKQFNPPGTAVIAGL